MNARERTPEEQIRYQQQFPHLYTTATQSVDAFGNIITLDSVTVKIRQSLSEARKIHKKLYGEDFCNALCIHAEDRRSCEIIQLLTKQYNEAAMSFAKHYKMMNERLTQPS